MTAHEGNFKCVNVVKLCACEFYIFLWTSLIWSHWVCGGMWSCLMSRIQIFTIQSATHWNSWRCPGGAAVVAVSIALGQRSEESEGSGVFSRIMWSSCSSFDLFQFDRCFSFDTLRSEDDPCCTSESMYPRCSQWLQRSWIPAGSWTGVGFVMKVFLRIQT